MNVLTENGRKMYDRTRAERKRCFSHVRIRRNYIWRINKNGIYEMKFSPVFLSTFLWTKLLSEVAEMIVSMIRGKCEKRNRFHQFWLHRTQTNCYHPPTHSFTLLEAIITQLRSSVGLAAGAMCNANSIHTSVYLFVNYSVDPRVATNALNVTWFTLDAATIGRVWCARAYAHVDGSWSSKVDASFTRCS